MIHEKAVERSVIAAAVRMLLSRDRVLKR